MFTLGTVRRYYTNPFTIARVPLLALFSLFFMLLSRPIITVHPRLAPLSFIIVRE
ncbi:hypothetical protein B0H14DRAFT_3503559 [Mycena olivaceomarginata]|nr:hypothetical protein B0H14DRAFT_3503559 [Mycena olivaceomarginata]